MGQILELDDTTRIIKPGVTSTWTYSGVDRSWTRTNNAVEQISQELYGNRYLPRNSFPDDISIRFMVGDIGITQKWVGFSSYDGRWRNASTPNPDLFGIGLTSGVTINFYEFDTPTPASVGAGFLPGGLTLAVGDELRIQIHKVSNDYVIEYKWRRPPGAEQVIRTSLKTNTQILAYLANYELFMRLSGTGNATGGATAIIKELQMEVTDSGTTWLILPDELGTADNAPLDMYEEGAETLLYGHAGLFPEDGLPIPITGQLFPLGDGREFIE